MTDFIFLGSKITADCDCSHEIKILAPWKKSYDINSDILFSWAPKSLQTVTAAMKLRYLLLGRKVMTNLDSVLKSRDITLTRKVHIIKAMGFPVVMYGCESWTVKKAECQRIDAFEILESPLDFKEIQPIPSEGDQPWDFFGRNNAKAETPVLWPPHVKS